MSLGCQPEHESCAVQRFFESPHRHFRVHGRHSFAFFAAMSPEMGFNAAPLRRMCHISNSASIDATNPGDTLVVHAGVSFHEKSRCRRATIALRSWYLNSLENVSERLQHLAVLYASPAVPSATQAKDALDSREMLLLTPRGSVVNMNRWWMSAGTALGSMRRAF